MKKILLIIAICISYISTAQNLESKIPNTAKAVVSMNGDRLFELVSTSDFDKYDFAKKMFKEFHKKDTTLDINSINDFGIDTNSKAYYFYKTTDSINYHTILVKLADKSKFENIISDSDRERIEEKGDINILVDNSGITAWNSKMLVTSFGDKSFTYFKDNKERFMKQAENEEDAYYQVKKKIGQEWTKEHILSIYSGGSSTSILANKNYLANKDRNAVASAWINNYGELISGAMSGMYGMAGMSSLNSLTGLQSSLYGFKSVVANLYFEEDGMRMSTQMEVSEDWQKIFKKIYKSKMDSNFFKYFNQNEALAYMSFSMDMEAVFEEYPTIMANIYGGMLPDSREELQVGSELMSMLLDEEAIGELITGDMLFVLNDFGEKEVTYTSYEYDEDYKRKEVIKAKKDIAPDFTLMIGSKKGKFLTKATLLGVKHKLAENKAGYFKVVAPKSEIPVDMYTAVKNDILFFTTSEDKISKIVKGSYGNNAGKHQKLIKNNISTFYVNGQQLFSKVPASELSRKEKNYLQFAQQNFTDAYFKSSKMKGNKMHSEMKINTTTSKGNSLKLMLDFIEVLAR